MSTSTVQLFDAIRTGDLPTLRAGLAADPSLAATRNEQGLSPVLWACYVRQPEALAVLLSAQPTLDLYEAVAAGEEDVARARLAANPVIVGSFSSDGFTALHLAAFFGRPALARELLAAGADPGMASRNPMQVAPLHSAATSRQAGIVRALLEAGARPDARQQGGFTPLMSAALNGDEESVAALLAFGADPSLTNDEGHSAADYAAERAHTALADKLRAPRG